MTAPAKGERFDVIVVGGGPGGSATALSLRAHAPELSVALLEATGYGQPRIGETLPPVARQFLRHLGVWERFRRDGHREVYGTASAWGSGQLRPEEFLHAARGSGWHLDRTRFDAALAAAAARRGVTVRTGTGLVGLSRDAGRWQIRLSNGSRLEAAFLVDASGRKRVVARRRGARSLPLDRLLGFARFFVQTQPADPRTLVEAFEDGWWYTAGLPGNRRVVVCMTDLDLARRLRLRSNDGWFRLLEATTWIRSALAGARPTGSLLVRPSESRRLDRVAGQGWLAVGDAASIFDPLSAQGIVKALRSGIFASYAVGDALTKDDESGLQRFCRYVEEEFESYRGARALHYAAEARWPRSAFWRRRRED